MRKSSSQIMAWLLWLPELLGESKRKHISHQRNDALRCI